MARTLRFIPPGSLVEVTSRTLQGRLLLRPSPALSEIILGILGRAQRRYQMPVHGYVFLSNHYHLLLSPRSAEQLARFVAFLNSNLAREAGRLHGWREKFWGRRYQAIVVSAEERAQIARLEYLLAHGAKESLVLSPRDWPGVHCVRALLDPGKAVPGVWFDRSAEYRARWRGQKFGARDFATPEAVGISPIPAWANLPIAEHARRVGDIVERIELASEARRRDTGVEPMGCARILRQSPHERPMRSKRSPAPLVHAATAAVRRSWTDAYRRFVAAYRRASEALRKGIEVVVFPEHCFPPPPRFFDGRRAVRALALAPTT